MNIQKILANAIVLVGFLAVPFIPFVVFSETSFFPFITGKNFVFRIIVEIMFVAWIVLAVLDPQYRPRKSQLFKAIAIFLGIITIAGLLGEDPVKSFWSNFERMEGIVTYFHLFAYFIVASTVLTVRGMWRQYLHLHLFAGVIMAGYAVLQWKGVLPVVQDGVRVNGTLGNAAYLGTYTFFNIFLALFFMVRQSLTTTGEQARLVGYGLIALLQIFVLYHTATRGAMLGFLAGLGLTVLLVALFERKQVAMRRVAIGTIVALVLFVGGFMALRDAPFMSQSPVLSRFASISFSEQTTKSRFMIWGMAIEGFKEHPILGWGMESFNFVFNKYYNPKMYSQEQWFDRAHNVFFDWLIAGGILGLVGYLALFGVAVYAIWRRPNNLSTVEKSVLTGLLGGYFFQNLFVFDNLTSLLLFYTFLGYIESLAHAQKHPAQNPSRASMFNTPRGEDDFPVTWVLGGGAVIFAVVLVYVVNYKGIMQNFTLLRALAERSEQGIAGNQKLFEKTIAYDSFGTAESREQLAQIALMGIMRAKNPTPDEIKFYTYATEQIVKEADTRPHDTRYQLFAGSFLSRSGQFDAALKYLEKARELSPKKQVVYFELGLVYGVLGRKADTEQAYRTAFELEPGFKEAGNAYVDFLVDKRNYKVPNYKEIERVFTLYAESNPMDFEAHVHLAGVYLATNRRAEGIKEIERALELNPPEKDKAGLTNYLRDIKAGKIVQ